METKVEEIWKDVVGYEGLYKVSSLGLVRSIFKSNVCPNGTILRPCTVAGYYFAVALYKDKGRKPFHVHKLVITAFTPNPENKPQVNHKDGNSFNNTVQNLEWVTHRENMRHWMKDKWKLMNKERIELVFSLRKNGHSQNKIANILGVNQSVISRILSGKDEFYQSIIEGQQFKYL